MDLSKIMYDINSKYFFGSFSKSFNNIEDLITNLKNNFNISNIEIDGNRILINEQDQVLVIEIYSDDDKIRIKEPIIESLSDNNYYFKD